MSGFGIVKTEKIGANTITMFINNITGKYGIHTTITKKLYWHYTPFGAEVAYKEWLKRFKQIQKYGRYSHDFIQ
ncbi:MAG TPA: hypothetical protein VK190_04955 [Pseudoneobacillus sp.]|nr:hypothetical protein [Pseudoneobacillus sp.]